MPGLIEALYASDVGKVDWHHPHVGALRSSQTRFDAERQLVVSATESNVFAGLHASNGSIGMVTEYTVMCRL